MSQSPEQLRPPPKWLSQVDIKTLAVDPASLFRISSYSTGEPYFGRNRAYRFDDNKTKKVTRFGTCYLGFDVKTAIAETLLHDQEPRNGRYLLSHSILGQKYVVRFSGQKLILGTMLGDQLKVLGGNGALSTILPYKLPQKWSAAVHAHPQALDGILYVSRHLNNKRAVVVFDRAKHKMKAVSYTPVSSAGPSVVRALKQLNIDFT